MKSTGTSRCARVPDAQVDLQVARLDDSGTAPPCTLASADFVETIAATLNAGPAEAS